jgi:hypothetical protein
MFGKWLAIIIGMVFLAIGGIAAFQFVSEQVWKDVSRWLQHGGTVQIEIASRNARVNARVLAFVLCALPITFLMAGTWLCGMAFRKNDNNEPE